MADAALETKPLNLSRKEIRILVSNMERLIQSGAPVEDWGSTKSTMDKLRTELDRKIKAQEQ